MSDARIDRFLVAGFHTAKERRREEEVFGCLGLPTSEPRRTWIEAGTLATFFCANIGGITVKIMARSRKRRKMINIYTTEKQGNQTRIGDGCIILPQSHRQKGQVSNFPTSPHPKNKNDVLTTHNSPTSAPIPPRRITRISDRAIHHSFPLL